MSLSETMLSSSRTPVTVVELPTFKLVLAVRVVKAPVLADVAPMVVPSIVPLLTSIGSKGAASRADFVIRLVALSDTSTMGISSFWSISAVRSCGSWDILMPSAIA